MPFRVYFCIFVTTVIILLHYCVPFVFYSSLICLPLIGFIFFASFFTHPSGHVYIFVIVLCLCRAFCVSLTIFHPFCYLSLSHDGYFASLSLFSACLCGFFASLGGCFLSPCSHKTDSLTRNVNIISYGTAAERSLGLSSFCNPFMIPTSQLSITKLESTGNRGPIRFRRGSL